MIDRIIKLKTVVFISFIISMYISVSWTFMAMLLGLLLIPPIAVATYLFIQGIPLIMKEIEDLLAYGKDFFLISVSREDIILEPQFR